MTRPRSRPSTGSGSSIGRVLGRSPEPARAGAGDVVPGPQAEHGRVALAPGPARPGPAAHQRVHVRGLIANRPEADRHVAPPPAPPRRRRADPPRAALPLGHGLRRARPGIAARRVGPARSGRPRRRPGRREPLRGRLGQPAPAQEAAAQGPGQPRRPPVHERRAVARRHVRPQADARRSYHGKPVPSNLPTERKTGAAFRSPFKFRKYGQSGIEVSEIFAHTAEMIDDICVIRSMHADVPNHEPSLMLMNCGEARQARPSLGSWVLYGLGTENQNLPGFIVMCPGGYPIAESQNWQSAFLPGIYQGTYLDSKHTEIEKLIAHIRNHGVGPAGPAGPARPAGRAQPRAPRAATGTRPSSRRGSSRSSWPTACRSEAADAFDISREPRARSATCTAPASTPASSWPPAGCSSAGVRFVQLWHGDGPALGQPRRPRDRPPRARPPVRPGHRRLPQGPEAARACSTTPWSIWGGEFGRTPDRRATDPRLERRAR